VTSPVIPEGSVIVTPSEVWQEVRATRDAVRDLAHKMDDIPDKIRDQETRLREIERRMWGAMGIVGFLAVAASICVSLLVK
jgi:hypothetical protein